ncbi:carbonic anhydrase isoform X1 [Zea mays]|uniref:Carbonic anhydrase n=1 Tax=Zea mays TaxID=4577 RepID=A0A1D6ERK0_MAIZE|nr:carbonic anhydrase isoform X1 [Zea mays]ONM22362.1 carbonic anhydrase4 [Zea mays]|eukprot:XP_008667450.1 carbonic anhydrase isoform X1 [Zea mays]
MPRTALLRLAAASTTRASSASAAARRLCPSSESDDGGERHAAARKDELLPPPRTPRPDERRLSRRGEHRRELLSVTMASRDHTGLTRQLLDFQHDTIDEVGAEHGPFMDLKARFMDFKQRNYVENFSNYQNLAEQQTPKFMVIACADSRVCPTAVLGFQPGEAFTVRNVANLVPPYEHEGSETSAALEFAINTLEVENVLVVGHSRCGGIQALMSMKDDSTSGSFIKNWVSIGKSARLSTRAAAGNLSFDMQCKHCEKESINSSLLNLLTYPWIEKRVNEGTLNLHGGYYNFVDCTFEKWTLLYREGLEGGSKYAIKNRSTWS